MPANKDQEILEELEKTSSGECPTQSIKPAGSSAYGIYAYPSKRGNLRWWARSVFSKNTGYRWCFVWSSRTKVIWWVPTTSRETSLFRDTSSRGIKNSGSKRLTHKLKFDIGKLLRAFHRPFLLSDLLCFVEKYCPARGLCVCILLKQTGSDRSTSNSWNAGGSALWCYSVQRSTHQRGKHPLAMDVYLQTCSNNVFLCQWVLRSFSHNAVGFDYTLRKFLSCMASGLSHKPSMRNHAN